MLANELVPLGVLDLDGQPSLERLIRGVEDYAVLVDILIKIVDKNIVPPS